MSRLKTLLAALTLGTGALIAPSALAEQVNILFVSNSFTKIAGVYNFVQTISEMNSNFMSGKTHEELV